MELGKVTSIKLARGINLDRYQVSTRNGEEAAIYAIISQMLLWLRQNSHTSVLRVRSSSMLINKIVYFSSKELNLNITRGW